MSIYLGSQFKLPKDRGLHGRRNKPAVVKTLIASMS